MLSNIINPTGTAEAHLGKDVKPLVKREQSRFEHPTAGGKRPWENSNALSCRRGGPSDPGFLSVYMKDAGTWAEKNLTVLVPKSDIKPYQIISERNKGNGGWGGTLLASLKTDISYLFGAPSSYRLLSFWKHLWYIFLHRRHVSIKGKNKKDSRMKMLREH